MLVIVAIPGPLDLDPAPDLKFTAVIAAALEVRERLQKVGLESFCKTTGGKGLHVVTPLKSGKDAVPWPAAYLRNDRTSTAVAVLSPRARAGAPISMPIRWEDVKSGLDPARYTVRTGPPALKKSKPCYLQTARSLASAIRQVAA
jgi:bifunctional non-homologous end joining protein LigD